MHTSTSVGGWIRSYLMFSPWTKNSASPSTCDGAMASAYTARCEWSGISTITRSASSHASAGVSTRRPSLAAFSRLPPARRAGRKADRDVHARVTQGQRVRVPLAAVTEDGDMPPLDKREVGAVVVEVLCHWSYLFLRVY